MSDAGDQNSVERKPDRRGLERADKIALAVVGIVGAVLTLGALFLARWLLAGVFGIIDLETGGVGWRDGFITAIVLAFGVIIVFAIVAGDGLLGELPLVLSGFFVLIAFFTVSIALVL